MCVGGGGLNLSILTSSTLGRLSNFAGGRCWRPGVTKLLPLLLLSPLPTLALGIVLDLDRGCCCCSMSRSAASATAATSGADTALPLASVRDCSKKGNDVLIPQDNIYYGTYIFSHLIDEPEVLHLSQRSPQTFVLQSHIKSRGRKVLLLSCRWRWLLLLLLLLLLFGLFSSDIRRPVHDLPQLLEAAMDAEAGRLRTVNVPGKKQEKTALLARAEATAATTTAGAERGTPTTYLSLT